MYSNQTGMLETPHGAMDSAVDQLVSPCSSTEYVMNYTWDPLEKNGLPYLVDVFASHDFQWLNFVAVNRGTCLEKFKTADAFPSMENPHRFICVFPNSVYVISELVGGNENQHGYMIRCRIPKTLQPLVRQIHTHTSLHVNLHVLENLEAEPIGDLKYPHFPSIPLTDTPNFANIPICPASPSSLQRQQFTLTAFIMLKSSYNKKHFSNKGAKIEVTVGRLPDWIDYHRTQGFDHFIIYDNDEERNGPIQQLLQPLIDDGTVTYRWFSAQLLCYRDHGHMINSRAQWFQATSTLSALHRYGFATKYLAHPDVDEFYVPLQKDTTVLEIVERQLGSEEDVDVLKFKPTVIDYCDGKMVQGNETVVESMKCITTQHASDVKLIIKTHRIWSFIVHYPLHTVNWTKPICATVDDKQEAFLAHFRNQQKPGLVKSKWKTRTHIMDDFLRKRNVSWADERFWRGEGGI